MKTLVFLLPDLGEGLPDAEIVEWAVKLGDTVALDAPLVSMETAKAVVDVPSPASGKLIKIYGNKGDIVETGHPLAEFELSDGPQRAQGHDTGHGHAQPAPVVAAPVVATPPAAAPTTTPTAVAEPADDAGSVVGAVSVGNSLVTEAVVSIAGVKAVPAVRALAKKLGVDLARIRPTGNDAIVTLADVKNAAANPAQLRAAAVIEDAVAPALAASKVLPLPPQFQFDVSEPIRGVRRNMARAMAQAHAEVVPTTLTEDADLHQWDRHQDVTARLIRGMVAACRAEPGLNAWFDSKEPSSSSAERGRTEHVARVLHSRVDVGIAVDTAEGLFVPALRNAHTLSAQQIKAQVQQLRVQTEARSLPPAELSGYTIMLSNFGMFAGRYATPVIAPPCVAILAAGRARLQVVPVMGGVATHRMLPLSLTFDHRACTGGEAARWLRALLNDLESAD
jgi:2-oxoisovalerate dehydrogenase E2 component (dihydrolipoyl transacylase)